MSPQTKSQNKTLLNQRMKILSLAVVCLSVFAACAPKVYVIDRASILEEESGGEWPSIDEAQRKKMLKTSPSPQKSSSKTGAKEKLTRILEPVDSIPAGNQ